MLPGKIKNVSFSCSYSFVCSLCPLNGDGEIDTKNCVPCILDKSGARCAIGYREQNLGVSFSFYVWTVVLGVLLGIVVCFLVILVGCFMTRERKQRDEEKRRREAHERRQQAIALNTTAADDAPVSFKMCRWRPSLDAHDFRRRAASDSRRPIVRRAAFSPSASTSCRARPPSRLPQLRVTRSIFFV